MLSILATNVDGLRVSLFSEDGTDSFKLLYFKKYETRCLLYNITSLYIIKYIFRRVSKNKHGSACPRPLLGINALTDKLDCYRETQVFEIPCM